MGDDRADRRETVELVSEEVDRMGLFADDLLLLAETEHGDFLELDELALEPFTEELLARVRGLADRDWALVQTGGGEIVADRRRVTQAIMNLARNAIAVTLPGDRIELGSACDDGQARLWIASPTDSAVGSGLDEDAPDGEGEPRPSAAGLGLSIAKTIAEGHGGRLEVDTESKAAVTFTCVIPAVASPRAVPA